MTPPDRSGADPGPVRGPRYGADLALLGMLSLLWGSSYTLIRLGVATIPPVTLIASRTLIAGLLLLGVMRLRGLALPRDLVSWRQFLTQAMLNSVVPFTLIAWAERDVGAGLAAILNSTSPIQAFLLTRLVARGEAVTPRRVFGIAAGLGGTCLVVGAGALHQLGSHLVAQLAIVAATSCYAGAAVYGRTFAGITPLAPAAGSLLCGAAILTPLSLAVERPWRATPSTTSLLALLALAVASTALAFVIYFHLVAALGSLAATAQSYLRVPVGVAVGVLWLGERLAPAAWVGLAAVVVGVAAMATGPVRSTATGVPLRKRPPRRPGTAPPPRTGRTGPAPHR